MHKEIHDFDKSEPIGRKYEIEIAETWPLLFELYEGGNEYDLTVIPNGKSFELKTEHGYTLQPGFPKGHKPRTTTNIFIEIISNERFMTIGGPWRALRDGVNFYSHLFPHLADRDLFLFDDLGILCDRCERLIAGLPMWRQANPSKVYNRNHITLGYYLPIKGFEDLFNRVKLGEDIEMYL